MLEEEGLAGSGELKHKTVHGYQIGVVVQVLLFIPTWLLGKT